MLFYIATTATHPWIPSCTNIKLTFTCRLTSIGYTMTDFHQQFLEIYTRIFCNIYQNINQIFDSVLDLDRSPDLAC